MADGDDVLEQLHEHLDGCDGAVAVVLDDDEGILTYLYDAETDDEPGLAKTTYLAAAGRDFLDNLETWALQEAGRRGNPHGDESATIVDANAPDGDPESPEYQ